MKRICALPSGSLDVRQTSSFDTVGVHNKLLCLGVASVLRL